MSDDERPETETETEPTAEPTAEPTPEPTQSSEASEPKAPVSAASRARRIGGRPVVPGASPVADTGTRSGQPGSGAGRHVAAPTVPAPPKTPKAPKAPKVPKPDGQANANAELIAWIPAAVLGAAMVVLVVFIAVAAHGVYYAKSGGVSASARNTNQEAALAAAKTCIAAINTYDYRKLDDAETAALACSTGAFTSSLKTTFDKTIKPEAPLAKSSQTAQVNVAGLRAVNADGNQVEILMYGQLTVTNLQTASSGTPRYDPFGIVVTMDKVGSKWLVAKYENDVRPTGGS